jgi:small subunit ribosomal protein S16
VAVRIRLQRKGAKHMAFYRIVAADSRSPRDGRFIEQLGYYDPLCDPPDISIDTPKVIEWLGNGAQPSGTVETLLRRIGVMRIWHEVKQGKALEDLAHIEEEARKRLEAKASMDRRRKEEAKMAGAAKKADAEKAEEGEKAEKAETAPADEPVDATPAEEPADVDVKDAAAAGPEAPSDDTKSEPKAPAAEEPADQADSGETADADPKDAAPDSGGGASQQDGEGGDTADEAPADDAPAEPEDKKPE